MATHIVDLKLAFEIFRARLKIAEDTSKTTTEEMQQVLATHIQAFGKVLDSWSIAAPIHKFISIYKNFYNEQYKGGSSHVRYY